MLQLLALGVALAAPSVARAEPRGFMCCDHAGVQRVVTEVLDLGEALSGKGDRAPAAHAYALLAALRTVRGLSEPESALVDEMYSALEAVRNGDAAAIRKPFQSISRGAIALAMRHEGGSMSVVEMRCSDPGPWLQRDGRKELSPWGQGCRR